MTYRYAIYYAPAAQSPLWQAAVQWLGRDPAAEGEGLVSSRPFADAAAMDPLMASACRYGFHATIKSPMRLAEGRSGDELETALADFAAANAPVDMGEMIIASLHGFLAIIPRNQPQALTDFAARCVTAFEPFRRPLSEADRAGRAAKGLTPRQLELLERFGYPYVLEQFQFHMTLTDRLPADQHDQVLDEAQSWFAKAVPNRLMLDRLALFIEPEPGAPFRRVADFPLNPDASNPNAV